MTPQRISFARTLPILALLIPYVIIAVPATLIYTHLRNISGNGQAVRFHSRRYDFTIQPKNFLRTSILAPAETTSHSIQALNVPGFIIEFGVDRFLHTWPVEWVPPGMDHMQWRAFILPVCCLPFWWFAGIGIDALTTRHRRPWWALLLGSILWAFIGLMETGFWFGLSKSDRNDIVFPCVGLALWFVLLSAFPIAWTQQELAWRRTKANLEARLSAELP